MLELEAIAREADHLRCQLKLPQIRQILERLVWRSLWTVLPGLTAAVSPAEPNPAEPIEADICWIVRLIGLGDPLAFGAVARSGAGALLESFLYSSFASVWFSAISADAAIFGAGAKAGDRHE